MGVGGGGGGGGGGGHSVNQHKKYSGDFHFKIHTEPWMWFESVAD